MNKGSPVSGQHGNAACTNSTQPTPAVAGEETLTTLHGMHWSNPTAGAVLQKAKAALRKHANSE